MATATSNTTTAKQPTYAELQAQLAAAQQQLAQQQADKYNITFKTSGGPEGSGGMILYGLQRFPITLKAQQWEKLVELAKDGTIAARLAEHVAGTLPVKLVEKREK